MNRITRMTARLAAAAVAAFAIGSAVASAPAFAAVQQPPPGGGTVNGNVVVGSSLTFAFTSGTSFTVAPGATDMAAVAFTLATNDQLGWSISEAAPDLSDGAAGDTLPATDLSEVLHYAMVFPAAPGQTGAESLTNPGGIIISDTHASLPAGNVFSQDWSASAVPANTPAGTYATTITYVAAGN